MAGLGFFFMGRGLALPFGCKDKDIFKTQTRGLEKKWKKNGKKNGWCHHSTSHPYQTQTKPNYKTKIPATRPAARLARAVTVNVFTRCHLPRLTWLSRSVTRCWASLLPWLHVATCCWLASRAAWVDMVAC